MTNDEDWLRALLPLLAPVAPAALALLQHAPPHEEFGWTPAWPPDARPLAHAGPRVPQRGWLLHLPAAAPRALLLDADPGLDPVGAPLTLVRQLVRSAWRLREPGAATAIGDPARQAMHDLRNGLNSVSMTSAVVASAAGLPEPLRGFVDDLQGAARRSLRALAELSEWMPPR
jgi:hypothetical protein